MSYTMDKQEREIFLMERPEIETFLEAIVGECELPKMGLEDICPPFNDAYTIASVLGDPNYLFIKKPEY